MANSLILTKAQNAVTAHDWGTAARLYKELLRGDPSNMSYIEHLGSIYVRAGQDEKAIPYYEQIITFSPSNTAAMISLGGIYRRLKRYEESVSILQKAQDIENSVSVNYNLGFTYKEMGDYDEAVDAFESVISNNPDDVLAHNHLGSIYYALKEYDKSISAFKRGLQVDQNHPILNYNLAHSYEDLRNYPDAIRCYEIALKTRPGWIEAIRDFSELLIKCQNTKQAQELVEQSIKLHPDDVEMLCILGRIYLNQFDYDNATKTFKKAESLKQNDISILVGLAKSLEKGMKLNEAMEKITEAAEIAPDNLDVCKQYAHILLSAQRYDKALNLIKTIDEKSNGKDLQILDLYGQYFVCRGDEEAANTYFEQIKKINHHYKDYMINAADRYIQTGNYDKAEKMADTFIQSRPQLGEGYNILGTVQNARGELKKAKLEYEKGISLKNPNIYAVKELEKIYDQLQKNKEMYNDEEAPISVDADEMKEEEFLEENSESKKGGLVENEDGELEYNEMENISPIDQSFAENSDEFWEDFDDDPDAEQKTLVDEEDEYDENSEEENFMSYMTPDAGEAESLQNGLLQDDEFDFSEFDDGDSEDELLPDSKPEEKNEEEPVVQEKSPIQTLSQPAEEVKAEAEIPSQPAETFTEALADAPALDSDPVDDFDSMQNADQFDEQDLAPEPEPAKNKADYETEDELSFNDAFEKSISDFGKEFEKADQMMKDLKNQQKELDLQQREFELKQRELANDLRHENEKLIEEKVDRAVDKAVDKKLQSYDLPEREEEVEIEASPAPVMEEMSVPEVEESVENDSVSEGDFEAEINSEAEADAGLETEVVAEDEPADETDDNIEVADEELSETEAEGSDNIENDSEIDIAENTDENAAESEEELDMTLDFEKPFEIISEDYTDYPFLSVDDILLMGGGRIVMDSDESENQEEKEETTSPATNSSEDTESDEMFITADDMLDKIERILNDNESANEYSQEIELFKKLKILADSLPDSEKNSSSACRMRMMIDYIIAKMSGKPGLLVTAESLLKSGVLGKEYDRQLTIEIEDELSNELIKHVLIDMKKLAKGLVDKDLSEALCVTADSILEKITLIDQKSAIF